jgi:altronate dehydratase
MFDNACGFKRFAALGLVVGLGCTDCAAANDLLTTIDIYQLKAAARENEKRMAAMQAEQQKLSQQIELLYALVGAMATNTNAKKAEMPPKNDVMAGRPAAPVAAPVDPIKPAQPSNDLEF